LEQFLDK